MPQLSEQRTGFSHVTTIRLREEQVEWLQARIGVEERSVSSEIRRLIEQAREAEREGATA